MNERQAEMVANVVISAAVVAAAAYVIRDPRLRRAAWHILRRAAAAAGPFLVAEARKAWAESGSRPPGAEWPG